MCFWRPVGVRAGEVGAPLEALRQSSGAEPTCRRMWERSLGEAA